MNLQGWVRTEALPVLTNDDLFLRLALLLDLGQGQSVLAQRARTFQLFQVDGRVIGRTAPSKRRRNHAFADVIADRTAWYSASFRQLIQRESRRSGVNHAINLVRSALSGSASLYLGSTVQVERDVPVGILYFGLAIAALIFAIQLLRSKYVLKEKRAQRDRGAYTMFAGLMILVSIGAFMLGLAST